MTHKNEKCTLWNDLKQFVYKIFLILKKYFMLKYKQVALDYDTKNIFNFCTW